MSRPDYHRIHATDRLHQARYRIAQEAARWMSEHGVHDYRRAKHKAARRLGIGDELALPDNREIDAALREHQRLFLADSQPVALRQRREAALSAMRFFAAFQPRLVGPVLEGTAGDHTPVTLHLFADDVETFMRFLAEHQIQARQQSRRLRVARDSIAEYPLFVVIADGLMFELLVLPDVMLRQAPLDAADGRPGARATSATVEALLATS